MHEQEQHEMSLETTHPSGAEEWACPTCGRRFLLQWPPNYKKIILERGDEYARHSGGKGGLRMSAIQVTNENEETSLNEEQKLTPWLEWLESVDFDNWWNQDTSVDME